MRIGLMRVCALTLLPGLFLLGLCTACPGGATNTPADSPPARAEETNDAQQTLRSYLQLQEQLHSTLLTIERARKDGEAVAKANADAITARLEGIETKLIRQREEETALLKNSNQVTLVAAGVFAGLGLLAMIFTGWFLLRAMNRLAAVAASLPSGHVLGHGPASPFVSADLPNLNLNSIEPASTRLLGVIDRLEKRVHELENTSQLTLPADAKAPSNGAHQRSEESHDVTNDFADSPAALAERPETLVASGDRVSPVLGKGQSLLSLDKPEEALKCFEEALSLDPGNAEAWVKKGTALERMKRLEDAIGCYDRAIAANPVMTLAYLYKGGICNQLERFTEALECYEQALRSQQKSAVH